LNKTIPTVDYSNCWYDKENKKRIWFYIQILEQTFFYYNELKPILSSFLPSELSTRPKQRILLLHGEKSFTLWLTSR